MVIRIAAMSDWSVSYYESTAVRGHEAGGGLAEYYSERDTRAPVVLVAGDREFAEQAMGVRHGEGISQEEVTQWFQSGVAPAGPGVGKSRPGTPGWDVLFTVPKSVSVLAALSEDPAVSAIITRCVADAAQDAMAYLHQHAGYTRVTNPLDSSKKDLQRLPAVPFVAYFHHTARPTADGTCDPHMHIHALLPGKIARADGRMVAIDSQSLYHEAKAGGMIFQHMLRDRMSATDLGTLWNEVDPHTGIAEIAGFDPAFLTSFSRRTSEIMEWAKENLSDYAAAQQDAERSDAEQVAHKWRKGEREFLDVAQKATRNKKLETLHYDELRAQWRNDPRAAGFDYVPFIGAVRAEAAAKGPGRAPEAAAVFELLGSVQNTWTRADVVEAVTGLWESGRGIEVPSVSQIEERVDQVLDEAGFQMVADGKSWHREGHVRYTDATTLLREADVMEMCTMRSRTFGLDVNERWFRNQGLSAEAAAVWNALATSQRFVNVLEAPAGAGKTTGLKTLRTIAEKQGRRVYLYSAARKAINAARDKDAASSYNTIAAFKNAVETNRLEWDARSIIVVDEAATVGDRDQYALFTAAAAAHAKVILIGDSYQAQPVEAAGGMFRDLSESLPWAQELSEVWRQKDPEEKAITLLMRDAQMQSDIERVTDWYSSRGRLVAGDARTMGDTIVVDYFEHTNSDKDVLVIADKWDTADALNWRIQRVYHHAWDQNLGYQLPAVPIAREQSVREHDIIMTNENNYNLEVDADPTITDIDGMPAPVTNADRWRVLSVDPERGSVHARRLTDHATVTMPAEYVRDHAVLGYAGTISAAQGSTAEVGLAIGDAATMTRNKAYPAGTRGTDDNRYYLIDTKAGADEHHHTHEAGVAERHLCTPAETRQLFADILARDDREQTALAQAEEALRDIAAGASPQDYLDAFNGMHPHAVQLIVQRAHWRDQLATEHGAEQAAAEREADGYEQISERAQQRALDHGRDIRDTDKALDRDDDLDRGIG